MTGTTKGHRRPLPDRATGEQEVQIGGPVLLRLCDVEPVLLKWLWPGRVPAGKLTLLAGDPDLGKSLVTLDIASRVSTGAHWPDAAEMQEPGGVVLLSAEDAVADYQATPLVEHIAAYIDYQTAKGPNARTVCCGLWGIVVKRVVQFLAAGPILEYAVIVPLFARKSQRWRGPRTHRRCKAGR